MSDEVKTITLSFGRNSIGQYQASINDENGGIRIAGGKYDGRGQVLLEKHLSEEDARQIRDYFNAAFPPAESTEPEPGGQAITKLESHRREE